MLNEAAIEYWQHTAYSVENIEAVCKKYDREQLFVLFDYSIEGLSITASQRVADTKEGHLETVVNFISDTIQAEEIIDFGRFLIWLEDGIWNNEISQRVPMFCFGKQNHDYYSLLMPDPAFLFDPAYKEEREILKELDTAIPFFEKQPTIFWRGSSTGPSILTDDWRNSPRIKLALESKALNDSMLLDAYLSKIIEFPEAHMAERIAELEILRDVVEFSTFARYRYQIDVDGMCCAWKSCFLKLAADCVLLKILSPYQQWYYHELKPWKNFIPIEEDLKNLKNVLEWLPEHQNECREISLAASKLISELTYESARSKFANDLRKILRNSPKN